MPPLVIAGAVMAAANVATNVYSTKKAAGVNEKSIAAQGASEARAVQLEREALKAQQAEADKQRQYAEWRARVDDQARKDWQAFENQRWQDYVRAHSPYWATGQQAFQSLSELAGLPGGGGASAGAPATGSAGSLATLAGGAMPTAGASGAAPLPTASTSPAGATSPAVAGTPTSGAVSSRGRYLEGVRARTRPPATMPQVSKGLLSLAEIAQLAQMTGGRGQPPTIPPLYG